MWISVSFQIKSFKNKIWQNTKATISLVWGFTLCHFIFTLIGMLSKPLFKEMFITLVLIGTVHVLGVVNFWYWKFIWLDIFMHFLGGLWVGLFTLIIASTFIKEPNLVRRMNVIFLSVCSAIVIGVAWEVFEYTSGISVASYDLYVKDTFKDMVMDTLGGVMAGIYGFNILKNSFKEALVSIKASTTFVTTYER